MSYGARAGPKVRTNHPTIVLAAILLFLFIWVIMCTYYPRSTVDS